MKRILPIALVALLVVVAGTTWLVAQSQTPTPAPLQDNDQIAESYRVETTPLELSVSIGGSVKPAREAVLTFNARDLVSEVNVEEEQTVRAGDVLARLDSGDVDILIRDAESTLASQRLRLSDLEAPERPIDIAVAEAALNTARAQANAALADAPSAEERRIAALEVEVARNEVWQTQLQRDARLDLQPEFRDGDSNDPDSEATQLNAAVAADEMAVTIEQIEQIDVDNTSYDRTALGSAQTAIVRANNLLDDLVGPADERDLNIAAISVASAEIALTLQREFYADRTITAPFDGLVVENNLTEGELPPNGAAIRLVDNSQYLVTLDADEVEVANLQPGQTARVRFDALPGVEVSGTITYIAPIDNASSAVPTYSVKVTLDPTDAPILLEMTADALIDVVALDDVIAVPTRYINQRGTAGATVFVLSDDSRVVEVPVTLGYTSGDLTQIVAGLTVGQTVVRLNEPA